MLYYKVLNKDNEIQGVITLNEFRFYHPQRKEFYMTTELKQAQYVIFNGQYYSVNWLAEAPELRKRYPKLEIETISEEEYIEWLKKQNSEQK